MESNYSCQDLQCQSLASAKEKELALRRTAKSTFRFVPIEWIIDSARVLFFGQTGPESETEIQSHCERRRSHNGMRQSITQEV